MGRLGEFLASPNANWKMVCKPSQRFSSNQLGALASNNGFASVAACAMLAPVSIAGRSALHG